MGRYTTGAVTTGESTRIELKYLLQNGYIKKGYEVRGELSWTNGSSIGIYSACQQTGGGFCLLSYSVTTEAGESVNKLYRVELKSRPSNLGIGEVLYFVCPTTHKLCTKLYRAYGSLIWQSREAYLAQGQRIYYRTQICSKLYTYTERFFSAEDRLVQLAKLGRQSIYKGLPTKRSCREAKLQGLVNICDVARWGITESLLGLTDIPRREHPIKLPDRATLARWNREARQRSARA